ncbi:MAG: factor H binding family protein [Mannheimia varigena]|nr:factor H binding family protein [Mannheimia varigena]
MSIKKVTLASLILLSLTACSSGDSGGNSNNATKPNAKPQTTQQQTDKAAAEKAAKEKSETERLAAEKATYEGKVFNYHGDTGHSGGFLTYNVDFTNRTGSGRVEGDWGMYILLDKGTIEKNTISSTTQQYYGESHYVNGHYNIEFFGKNAEEIAGKIQTDTDPNGRVESFGLAGTRGDIQ